MKTFKTRVYYKDTDCGNVVYYGRYLEFLEMSRTEFLREEGVNIGELHNQGVIFPVVNVNLNYHASAVLNDVLSISTAVLKVKRCKFVLYNEVRNESGRLLVSGTVSLACINNEGKPIRIPESVESVLRKHLEEDEK